MSRIVRTILGDIEAEKLGVTYCHDHLAVFPVEGVELEERLLIDEPDKTLEELFNFRNSGGCSIVDAQPFGAGRNPEVLRDLSAKSGVNIVASTGLHNLFFYPEDFYSKKASTEELVELFVSEIEEGMWRYDPSNPFRERTSIRAGLIKVATDSDGLTDYYKKVFKAAALASLKTGAAIMTHTELGRFAEDQIDFLLKNGLKEKKIIISHLDRKIDILRCTRIAESGVFLQFDTIRRFKYHSDTEEAELIAELLGRGYGDRILFGMDSTKERFRSYGSEFGLDYILTDFKELLFGAGVSEESFKAMLEKNPARALSIEVC